MLALFRERETRDELGFGAVRDAIADTSFPGTSTIETRLRYTLFVPWLYRHLEDERTPSAEVARKARRARSIWWLRCSTSRTATPTTVPGRQSMKRAPIPAEPRSK